MQEREGVMIKRARGGEFGNEEERREEERLVSRDIKFRRDSRRTVVYTVNGKK